MRISTLIFTCIVATLTACGGGGGNDTVVTTENKLTSTQAGNTTSNPITYQAVATEGELISYTVDTTALTYSYRIVESAYNKTGATGSGQLTRNSDGTYTPSGFNGKVSILESGLLLGAIYEDLNNDRVREMVPIIGVSNPITTTADAAGVYNFISRQCGTVCTNDYGTVKVLADGSWTSCVLGNLSAVNYSCQSSASGTITSFTSGRATLMHNGISAGSMLIFKDAGTGQKVVLLDLNGQSSLGKGAIFAASQSLPSSADGDWTYLHTNGTNGVVRVTGTTFTDTGKTAYGTNYNSPGSFTRDQPWNGFIRTASGATIMPAGSGLYAGYFGATGSMSIGVKR